MNAEKFKEVVEAQIKRCTDVLLVKAGEYATDGDRLHNFKVAASLQDVDPKTALAGMMAKHTVSVYDMCMSDKEYSEALWNEKITDSINYLLLLRALVQESIDTPVVINTAIPEAFGKRFVIPDLIYHPNDIDIGADISKKGGLHNGENSIHKDN